jgi:hypothetical protein
MSNATAIIDAEYSKFHVLIVNQIAATMIATTIAAQTTGVAFFELPLRGESLAP